jgi:hypothetical protein
MDKGLGRFQPYCIYTVRAGLLPGYHLNQNTSVMFCLFLFLTPYIQPSFSGVQVRGFVWNSSASELLPRLLKAYLLNNQQYYLLQSNWAKKPKNPI